MYISYVSYKYIYKYIYFFHLGNKRKQIIQVVQYLDERLKELDEEKEELRKYQQLDKQRKSLEYTIYDKELHDARHKLGEVSSFRCLDYKDVNCFYHSCSSPLYFLHGVLTMVLV